MANGDIGAPALGIGAQKEASAGGCFPSRKWVSELLRLIAVGTPVARRPPHRSQRAQLAHWALASGPDVKALAGPGMQDTRCG